MGGGRIKELTARNRRQPASPRPRIPFPFPLPAAKMAERPVIPWHCGEGALRARRALRTGYAERVRLPSNSGARGAGARTLASRRGRAHRGACGKLRPLWPNVGRVSQRSDGADDAGPSSVAFAGPPGQCADVAHGVVVVHRWPPGLRRGGAAPDRGRGGRHPLLSRRWRTRRRQGEP